MFRTRIKPDGVELGLLAGGLLGPLAQLIALVEHSTFLSSSKASESASLASLS